MVKEILEEILPYLNFYPDEELKPEPEDDNPQDGQTPEGESPQDGQAPEGDNPQDGQTPEGENPQEAQEPEDGPADFFEE